MRQQWLYIVVFICEVFLVKIGATSNVNLDLFKNKDVLATRTIPDLTALRFPQTVGENKIDYFNKLLAAWDNLSFDRTFISRGKRNLFDFFSFHFKPDYELIITIA